MSNVVMYLRLAAQLGSGIMDDTMGEGDWTEIEAHTGQICGLTWSDDGANLYTGSFDGVLNKWSLGDDGTLALSKSVDVKADILELAWSPCLGLPVISRGGEIVAFDEELIGTMVEALQGVRTNQIHFQPNGNLVALCELRSPSDGKAYEPWVTVRTATGEPRQLTDLPVSVSPWKHTDMAWRPGGSLLAVLIGNEVQFVSGSSGNVLETQWWVGRWANALTWVSEDEIAIAFGDGNVRIYSWAENQHPSYRGAFAPKTKSLLERHEDCVLGLASEHAGKFASYDRNTVEVWGTSGESFSTLRLPQFERSGSRGLVLHPSQNIVIAARSNVLYECRFRNSVEDAVPILDGPKEIRTKHLAKILDRAGLLQLRKLTSDDVRADWEIGIRAEDGEAVLNETIATRQSAGLLGTIAAYAGRAMSEVFQDSDSTDRRTLEDISLRAPEAASEDRRKVRVALLLALRNKWLRSTADQKPMILAASFALSALTQVSYRLSLESEFLSGAADEIEDDDIRFAFKQAINVEAKIETAADLQQMLMLIETVVGAVLRSFPNRSTTSQGEAGLDASGTSALAKTIEDFFLVAARQELDAIREYLASAGIDTEQTFIENRPIDVLHIETEHRGKIPVGVLMPLTKGKSGAAEAIYALQKYPQIRNVIMVGMAAAIKGKADLLDVLVPRSIYDVGPIGTSNRKFQIEQESGNMDARLQSIAVVRDMRDLAHPPIQVVTHKKMICVPAKIDDVNHKLAQAMLNVDRANVVGLEMESAALADAQTRHFGPLKTAYLMVKGVADYAGEKPDEEEIRKLSVIPELAPLLEDPDPTNSKPLKKALQAEATRRALLVALEILRKLP